MSDRHPLISVEQVSLAATVGSAYLLQDINFSIERGEAIAIIGPSGAGKTSLLRLLNRLYTPTTGSIKLAGKPYQSISVYKLRQQVMLVPQEPKLLGMTVADTLAYPLKIQQLPEEEIQQRVEQTRRQLQIPGEWLERDELQLSMGQKQRVAIARALTGQPEIILLDEPTSALDFGRASFILELLQQLSSKGQLTVVMVNHQLEWVKNFARRVIYLEKGTIRSDQSSVEIDWPQLQENLVTAQKLEAQAWE